MAFIAALDLQDVADPDRPNVGQVSLLDVLPHLTVDLHRAPDELLDRLFGLIQLTVQVHYATNDATLSVTLPVDNLAELAEIQRSTLPAMPLTATKAQVERSVRPVRAPGQIRAGCTRVYDPLSLPGRRRQAAHD